VASNFNFSLKKPASNLIFFLSKKTNGKKKKKKPRHSDFVDSQGTL